MLDRAMPRMPFYGLSDVEAMLEAFAYAYWSQYCDEAVQPRVESSYQNAWGHDDRTMYASVSLGRPGFVMARWVGGTRRKMIVAIPGATTWAQLWPIRSGFQAINPTGLTGYVASPYATFADDIYTLLLADTNFMNSLNDPASGVTFTGFSLGAGIAEVLAYRIQLLKPTKRVRLVQFACPMVGTSRWIRNQNPGVQRIAVKTALDPIGHFPLPIPSTPPTSLNLWATTPTFFTQQPGTLHYNMHGDIVAGEDYHIPGLMASIAAVSSYPPPFQTTWWHHVSNTYRMMLTHMAERMEQLKLRFRYLEHNDENRWGLDFVPGSFDWAPLMTLGTPQPDPVVWRLPVSVMRLLQEADIGEETQVQNQSFTIRERAAPERSIFW